LVQIQLWASTEGVTKMDDHLKKTLEDIYTHSCFIMADVGRIVPLLFIVKDSEVFPIFTDDHIKISIGQYISLSIDIARENDAEGLAMICEQYMVSGKVVDKEIQDFLGDLKKLSKSENKKEYLVLSYIEASGKTHMLMGEIEKSNLGTRYVKKQR
jgi:hypothetical protein